MGRMKEAVQTREGSRLTRRTFVRGIALAGAAFGFIPCARATGLFAAPDASRISSPELNSSHAVISFHMDQPYLDASGSALPYNFPEGTRSVALAAGWSENVLRSSIYQL
jgi:hypothetical protein